MNQTNKASDSNFLSQENTGKTNCFFKKEKEIEAREMEEIIEREKRELRILWSSARYDPFYNTIEYFWLRF